MRPLEVMRPWWQNLHEWDSRELPSPTIRGNRKLMSLNQEVAPRQACSCLTIGIRLPSPGSASAWPLASDFPKNREMNFRGTVLPVSLIQSDMLDANCRS